VASFGEASRRLGPQAEPPDRRYSFGACYDPASLKYIFTWDWSAWAQNMTGDRDPFNLQLPRIGFVDITRKKQYHPDLAVPLQLFPIEQWRRAKKAHV
jgi:hypothetical protein